jgi:soluble lytic murein transglycosylase-like protein
MVATPELVKLAKSMATKHGLDPALVCAVVEQESAWNPLAIRYEPAFMAKYLAPLYTNNKISATEAYSRCFSWGLMQLMGQAARERGAAFIYLSALCDPANGLEWGCIHLKGKLAAAAGDTHKALQLWNGGGNPDYADEVLARLSRYQVIEHGGEVASD